MCSARPAAYERAPPPPSPLPFSPFRTQGLRSRAAARLVGELAVSAEGTEGLVKGLGAALADNPSLALQLRSLLK